MRKLLRNMAKAKMKAMGYDKINRRMRNGQWRRVTGAYPVNLITGKKMSEGFKGKKKYKKGRQNPVFAY